MRVCGRFYIPEPGDSPERLEAILRQAEERAGQPLKRGEISPGDTAAVLAENRAGKVAAFPMRWGFRVGSRLVFNARSESAGSKAMFRESMERRRCLIPAAYYFEWDHRFHPRPKYRFALPDTGVMYLAGLYRLEDREPVFTVLTRDAAPDLAVFHNRMPVIPAAARARAWLEATVDPMWAIADARSELVWQSETPSLLDALGGQTTEFQD